MMRKTLGVSLLVLLLTGSVSAGIMGNDKPVSPPQPASAVQEPLDDATLHDVASTPDTLTQIALELLAVLL